MGYKARGRGTAGRSRQPSLPAPRLPQPLAFRPLTSICPEPSASNKSKASRSCSRCWSLRGNAGPGAAPLPAAASPGAMEGPPAPWGLLRAGPARRHGNRASQLWGAGRAPLGFWDLFQMLTLCPRFTPTNTQTGAPWFSWFVWNAHPLPEVCSYKHTKSFHGCQQRNWSEIPISVLCIKFSCREAFKTALPLPCLESWSFGARQAQMLTENDPHLLFWRRSITAQPSALNCILSCSC